MSKSYKAGRIPIPDSDMLNCFIWRISIDPYHNRDASTATNIFELPGLRTRNGHDGYLEPTSFGLYQPTYHSQTHYPSQHLNEDGLLFKFKVEASDIEEVVENFSVLDLFN